MAQLDRSLAPDARHCPATLMPYPAFTRTVCPPPAPYRFAVAMFAPFPEAGATYAYLPWLVPQKMTQSAYLREGEGGQKSGEGGGTSIISPLSRSLC